MSNKTTPTDVDPIAFINAIEDAGKRADALELLHLFENLSGQPAKMWGPSIIGFGQYDYRYDSGHSGSFFRTGFSPRKSQHSIYIMAGLEKYAEQLDKLGPHKIGKSCLYIKKLSAINLDVLKDIIRDSLDYMNEKYPVEQ